MEAFGELTGVALASSRRHLARAESRSSFSSERAKCGRVYCVQGGINDVTDWWPLLCLDERCINCMTAYDPDYILMISD